MKYSTIKVLTQLVQIANVPTSNFEEWQKRHFAFIESVKKCFTSINIDLDFKECSEPTRNYLESYLTFDFNAFINSFLNTSCYLTNEDYQRFEMLINLIELGKLNLSIKISPIKELSNLKQFQPILKIDGKLNGVDIKIFQLRTIIDFIGGEDFNDGFTINQDRTISIMVI